MFKLYQSFQLPLKGIKRSYFTSPTTKSRSFYYGLGLGASALLYGLYHLVKSDDNINEIDFVPFTLTSKTKLNHNTSLFHLQGTSPINFPLLSHIQVKHHLMQIMRPYTVLPLEFQKTKDGFLQKDIVLMIKEYNDGPMSQFLFRKKVGDKVEVRGPYYTIREELKKEGKLIMLAAGTGIAPFYQILKVVLNGETKQKFELFYFNRNKEDILLKKELDEMKLKFEDQVKVYYYCEDNKGDDEIANGIVNFELINNYLKKNPLSSNDKILICGPEGFLRAIGGAKLNDYEDGEVTGILGKLNITKEQVYKL
ncbi:ferredoxin reductase-like protein [Neoconidiobolus thromboides FSU 785]|nr:ferredoxin reductase-like protein [Neoconidiobolus thromboides FSU 785]